MKIILVISILIVGMVPYAMAQLMMGGQTEQLAVDIIIGQDDSVRVIHSLAENAQPTTLELVAGTVSNITVSDQRGNDFEYGVGGSEGATSLILFTPNDGLIVEYDLEGVLLLEDGVWSWDYQYYRHPRSVFHMPEAADLIFVNGNPVPMIGTNRLGCHGCDMILEYSTEEASKTFSITKDDKEFDIPIRSLAGISDVRFEPSTQSLVFNVDGPGKFVTLPIAYELLASPYKVYLDGETILKHEFLRDDNGVSLSIKPDTSGVIRITGAGQESNMISGIDEAQEDQDDQGTAVDDDANIGVLVAAVAVGLAVITAIALRYRRRLIRH